MSPAEDLDLESTESFDRAWDAGAKIAAERAREYLNKPIPGFDLLFLLDGSFASRVVELKRTLDAYDDDMDDSTSVVVAHVYAESAELDARARWGFPRNPTPALEGQISQA